MGCSVAPSFSKSILRGSKYGWTTTARKAKQSAGSLHKTQTELGSCIRVRLASPRTRFTEIVATCAGEEETPTTVDQRPSHPFNRIALLAGVVWVLSWQMHPALADSFDEYTSLIEERTGRSALLGLTESPNKKIEEPRMKLDPALQLELDKQKITELKEQLKAARRSSPTPYFTSPVPLPSPPPPAPEKGEPVFKTEKIEELKQGGRSGLLKYLGIVLAGGLAAYTVVTSQNKEAENELRQELDRKAQSVLDLKDEVSNAVAAVEEGKRLNDEISQSKEAEARANLEKTQLLLKEKEAVIREVEATKKALEAEKKVVEATTEEARTVASVLEAEREAKASVVEEIDEIRKTLETSEGNLLRERMLAKDIESKTQDLEEALKKSKQGNADLMKKGKRLETSLAEKSAQLSEANEQKSGLEKDLTQLRSDYGNQGEKLTEKEAEISSLTESAKELDTERMELAHSFLDKINNARSMREKAEEELNLLSRELEREKETTRQTRMEIENKNERLANKDQVISLLESELESAKGDIEQLQSEMEKVQIAYKRSTTELETERGFRSETDDRLKRLSSELTDAWKQVEVGVEDTQKRQEEIDSLRKEMEDVKDQYYLVSDKVEEEQGRLVEAQKTAAEFSSQISSLQSARKKAEKRAGDLSKELEAAKIAAEEARNKMKAEEDGKTLAMTECTKLQKELVSLQSKAQKAQKELQKARSKLDAEVAARASAEELVSELKGKMATSKRATS